MTAAAARKLQKEIDNVLKKVDDGLSEFADYWEQATAAGSNQQKEKLGEELKKSINKLQRFRVQIREWLAQSGVQSNCKDKLEDARKRVEYDMQRFKELEREIKTKAFSTCALAKGDELELEEAEKLKYQEWLTQTIQGLNDQVDLFEADLELMGNKRSLNSDERVNQTQFKALQERHRWHIKKLELILRAMDNDAIDMSDLALIKDSVEFYLDNNQDENCYHDETLYDGFDLTEFEERGQVRSPANGPKDSPSASNAKEETKKTKDKDKRRNSDKKEKKKEEREKKGGANTPQGGSAKSTRASGDSLKSPHNSSAETPHGGYGETREKDENDEVKVQEDQLLSEAAEFICKICQIHVAGCGPKLTSCSHLFCGDCIAQWFNQHPESQTWAQRARSAGPDRVVPCPVCKQPLNEKRDLYPVCGVTSRSENLLLWRMLSSLKIMCGNHPKVRPDGKCDWIGEYGSYQKHIAQCKNAIALDGTASTASDGGRPQALSMDFESDACSKTVSRQTSYKSSTPLLAPQNLRLSPASSPTLVPQLPSAAVAEPVQGASLRDVVASLMPGSRAADHAYSKDYSAPACAPKLPPTPAPTLAPSLMQSPLGGKGAGYPARKTSGGGSFSASADSSALNGNARSNGPPFTTKAVSSFEPTAGNTLLVEVGDTLEVLEQHSSGWTYAKSHSVASAGACGWIPSWLIQPQSPATSTDPAEETPAPRPAAPPTSPVVSSQAAAVAAPAAEQRRILRANSKFAATSPSQLTLAASDMIEVVERHASGWTYGRKVSDSHGVTSVEGWFPDWVVAQK